MLQNFRFEIILSNDNKNVNFNVKRGTVIATAIVNSISSASILPHRSKSFYGRLFLRLYCSVKAADFSDVTVDGDGKMNFGPLFGVKLDKNEKVISKNGTVHSLETIIHFLTHYNQNDATPYANYVQAAIEADAKDLVDERDAKQIYRYFNGQDKLLSIRWKCSLKRALNDYGEDEEDGEVDPISFGEDHPKCLEEVSRLGVDVMSRIVRRYMYQSKASEDDAKARIEKVLKLFNVANCDCENVSKLSSKTTQSKTIFLRSIWRKLLRAYKNNPNALDECRPLRNVECLESVAELEAKLSDVLCLLRLFPNKNASLIQRLVSISEKSRAQPTEAPSFEDTSSHKMSQVDRIPSEAVQMSSDVRIKLEPLLDKRMQADEDEAMVFPPLSSQTLVSNISENKASFKEASDDKDFQVVGHPVGVSVKPEDHNSSFEESVMSQVDHDAVSSDEMSTEEPKIEKTISTVDDEPVEEAQTVDMMAETVGVTSGNQSLSPLHGNIRDQDKAVMSVDESSEVETKIPDDVKEDLVLFFGHLKKAFCWEGKSEEDRLNVFIAATEKVIFKVEKMLV